MLLRCPVQSFDQALQGKAAGVSVTLPNGVLNNPPVIRIRGFNSISGSSSPLVVVDGVPMATGNFGGTAVTNALSDINPADIASMDILKDASATALYGSRAANGVILITTKRGSGGKTKVTYDGYVGMTEPYNIFEMMNAAQYIEHKNRAWINASGATAPSFHWLMMQTEILLIQSGLTKFTRKDFSRTMQLHSPAQLQQPTITSQLVIPIRHGMIKKNTFTRKNARLNIDHKLNKMIILGANIGYTNGYTESPVTGSSFATAGAARLAFVLPPNLGPYKNDGTGIIILKDQQSEEWVSHSLHSVIIILLLFLILTNSTTETDRLLSTVYGSIVPFKGLELKTQFGMDYLVSEQNYFQSPVTGDGYSTNGATGASNRKFRRWTWTNTINYNTTLAEKFNIGLLGGIEEQRTYDSSWSGGKTNVSDPFFEDYQGAWVTAGMGGGGIGENYYISYFGRASFNFNKKYYIEGSVRRDGFSGLAKDNKFGTFWGASAMWNASNEEFISNAIGSLFSDIRLKASYGKVGNMSAVGDFSSLFLYGSGVYGAVPTLAFTQAGNADLRWETSDKYDARFELQSA